MDKFEKRKAEFMEMAKELSEQFYKKNKDYNDSYFNQGIEGFGVDKILAKVDFYVQIKRKFSRLAGFAERRLLGSKEKSLVDDETEEDTIKDLSIYCIMELIKRGEKK